MGIQESGKVGATEGQKKTQGRSHSLLGTNPLESMPRQMSRYGVSQRLLDQTAAYGVDRTVIHLLDQEKHPNNPKLQICTVQLKPIPDYETA